MDITTRDLDAAALVPFFGIHVDFIRQDDVTDGGATDFTAVSSGTIAINAQNGGVARVSGVATTAATGGQIQCQGGHVFTDGKNVFFGCRAKINETTSANAASASELYAGLFPVDTSISASPPIDGIYFLKSSNGASIQCITMVGGTAQASTTLTTPTADKNFHHYGIAVFVPGPATNGVNAVTFSIDGVMVAQHINVALPASTVVTTPSLSFVSGDATGTKFIDIDYIRSAQPR